MRSRRAKRSLSPFQSRHHRRRRQNPPPSTAAKPPGDPSQPLAIGNPNKYQDWWNQNILKQSAPVKPAAAPGLAATADAGKCRIDLYIFDQSDIEDGFLLFRLEPNSSAFERIATLEAHTGAQPVHNVDPVPTGKEKYYASSFNAMGESPDEIVLAVVPDATCIPSPTLTSIPPSTSTGVLATWTL